MSSFTNSCVKGPSLHTRPMVHCVPFGWKISVMNLTLGGFVGYSSVNSSVRLNAPARRIFGTPRCGVRQLHATGQASTFEWRASKRACVCVCGNRSVEGMLPRCTVPAVTRMGVMRTGVLQMGVCDKEEVYTPSSKGVSSGLHQVKRQQPLHRWHQPFTDGQRASRCCFVLHDR